MRMGCSSSTTEGPHQSSSSSPLPNSARGNLSIREVDVVRDSWAIIAEHRAENGVEIFRRVFEMDKELKALFYRFSVNSDDKEKPESIEIDTDKFKHHADMVMQVFGECIDGLDNENNFEEHIETLRNVGQAHIKFNIRASMFQTFWPAMKPILQNELRDIYTEEVEEAWEHVCTFIINKLVEGLDRKEDLETADAEEQHMDTHTTAESPAELPAETPAE